MGTFPVRTVEDLQVLNERVFRLKDYFCPLPLVQEVGEVGTRIFQVISNFDIRISDLLANVLFRVNSIFNHILFILSIPPDRIMVTRRQNELLHIGIDVSRQTCYSSL